MKRLKSAIVAIAMTAAVLAVASPAGAGEGSWADTIGDNGSGYDSRGDITQMGVVYSDQSITVGVDAVNNEHPGSYNWAAQTYTGVIWDIDADLDGIRDYYVRYINDGAVVVTEVFDTSGSVRMCTGQPAYSSEFGYAASFFADCIGRPPAIQIRALMAYETDSTLSTDYVPSDGGWCCAVPRGAGVPTDPQPQPQPDPVLEGAGTHSGYWMITDNGEVSAFGDAKNFGNEIATTVKRVDVEPTPSGNGYWILADSGAVHAKGDAKWLGSALNTLAPGEKAAALSSTAAGDGYWIFTDRGRVLAFGTAKHVGDMAGVTLNGPVLDAVATPAGDGYWMVASDGGVFTFGNAKFYGSTGNMKLNKPVMSMAPDPDGSGYWLVASDGGIFAFDAQFYGSMGGTPLNKPISGIVPGAGGYMMVGEDGGIFAFGNVAFHGSLGANPPARPVVAVALMP